MEALREGGRARVGFEARVEFQLKRVVPGLGS